MKVDTKISNESVRKSGIELLKIFAIFLIVISHVTQTLGSTNTSVNFQDYVFLLGNASSNIQIVLLTLLQQTGALGNSIFFICSAWFLVEKTGSTRKKAFSLLSTVWFISILILCLYFIIFPSCLTKHDILHQLLPTFFSNNWYMTCYITFLFIYPWINMLITSLNQKQLLRIVLFSSFIWILINYFAPGAFNPSFLILWISIYLLIAYLKKYCEQLIKNCKFGIVLLLIGITGYIAQVVVTNYVGLHVSYFYNKVLWWNNNCCPFYIMIAIGSVIIASHSNYKVRFINYISSLSMFVYLFHENLLFRTYTRPAIWQYLYTNYGYSHIVIIDLSFAFVLFISSIIVSAIYKETIQRLVIMITNKIYSWLSKIYHELEGTLIKIK